MKAEKFIPLLGNALRAGKDHSHTWEQMRAMTNPPTSGLRFLFLDYRTAVSKLFKEATGQYPTQEQLEAIDPDFRVKEN